MSGETGCDEEYLNIETYTDIDTEIEFVCGGRCCTLYYSVFKPSMLWEI